MIAELVDAVLAAFQVATTDSGPDGTRLSRRAATFILVAGVFLIAAVMVALAVTVYVLAN